MDVADGLSRVLRLEDPAVANAEALDAAVHRGKDAVMDAKPVSISYTYE
jgi:hypothetical protein